MVWSDALSTFFEDGDLSESDGSSYLLPGTCLVGDFSYFPNGKSWKIHHDWGISVVIFLNIFWGSLKHIQDMWGIVSHMSMARKFRGYGIVAGE